MQIPILIEPIAGNGFRSRGGEPYALSAEGKTREEVLAKLQQQLETRLREGAQAVKLEVPEPAETNPWVKYAGMFKDDPLFEEVTEIMQNNRLKMDADPEIP